MYRFCEILARIIIHVLTYFSDMDYANQVGAGHYYEMYYQGSLTNFEIGEEGQEASKIYPDVKCTRMDEFLKIYA